jgi:hypothetical protein
MGSYRWVLNTEITQTHLSFEATILTALKYRIKFLPLEEELEGYCSDET